MIDLTESITKAQIAFALAVIAASLAYMAFGKNVVIGGKSKTSSKKSR